MVLALRWAYPMEDRSERQQGMASEEEEEEDDGDVGGA